MENEYKYYLIQFMQNGLFFNPDFLKTIDECIKVKIIKAPSEFNKPLFLVKFPGQSRNIFYIRSDYFKSVFAALESALTLNISPILKTRCENLFQQIKIEYSSTRGCSLEELIKFCKDSNSTGELSNFFNVETNSINFQGIYKPFIDYFNRRKLGTEMPVLTILSCLPPIDRCYILTYLLEDDPSNFEIYNKLSMALMKDGKYDDAVSLLNNAHQDCFLSDFNYNILLEKIEHLHRISGDNYDSPVNYEQSLQLVEQSNQTLSSIGMLEMCSEFNQIVVNFCNSKLSKQEKTTDGDI